MNLWMIIIGMGLVTFATRASFIFLPPHTRIPKGLQRSLKYVAAAVLPALIVPDVLFHGTPGSLPFDAERLIAAIIGILVAWATRNMVLTIVAGMAALLLQKWILPF
jgi:branched-subunit amino acid transport protein